jgi:hypothetical protein
MAGITTQRNLLKTQTLQRDAGIEVKTMRNKSSRLSRSQNLPKCPIKPKINRNQRRLMMPPTRKYERNGLRSMN